MECAVANWNVRRGGLYWNRWGMTRITAASPGILPMRPNNEAKKDPAR